MARWSAGRSQATPGSNARVRDPPRAEATRRPRAAAIRARVRRTRPRAPATRALDRAVRPRGRMTRTSRPRAPTMTPRRGPRAAVRPRISPRASRFLGPSCAWPARAIRGRGSISDPDHPIQHAGEPTGDRSARRGVLVLQAQPDGRLLALAGDGHELAFEALVRRYRRSLLAYCRRITPDCAEDVLQQALLQAWGALGAGAQVADARAWLYRIVHNTAISTARNTCEPPARLVDAIAPAGLEQVVEQRMAAQEALAHLAALPHLQREVMLGTALEGRSHEELAAELGLTGGSVRGLVYRARAALRAAAAALIPSPLLDWAVRCSLAGPTGSGYQALAGGSSVGVAGLLIKGGTAATLAGALAGAAAIVTTHAGHPAHPHARSAAIALAAPSRTTGAPATSRAVFASVSRVADAPIPAPKRTQTSDSASGQPTVRHSRPAVPNRNRRPGIRRRSERPIGPTDRAPMGSTSAPVQAVEPADSGSSYGSDATAASAAPTVTTSGQTQPTDATTTSDTSGSSSTGSDGYQQTSTNPQPTNDTTQPTSTTTQPTSTPPGD